MNTTELVEAPPTRIAGLGLGTFLILAGGGLLVFLFYLGTILKKSAQFYLRLCVAYLILWIFLLTAKRKSRWMDPSTDGHGHHARWTIETVDIFWVVRLFVGITMIMSTVKSVQCLIKWHLTRDVIARKVRPTAERRGKYFV